jgi:hypothetical protein
MNSKLFSAMAGGLISCVFLTVSSNTVRAQAESGTAPAPQAEKAAAMFRGWLFPEKTEGEIKMVMLKEQAPEAIPLATSNNGERSATSDYSRLGEGGGLVEIRSGDRVLASANLSLRRDRYYTLTAVQSGGSWKLKVFADGSEAQNAADRPLRVLNFADDCDINLAFRGAKPLKVPERGIGEMRAPAETAMLELELFSRQGKSLGQALLEIDASTAGSVYIVVSPDYRGRMRPRIIYGGQPSETQDVAKDLGGQS